MTSAKESEERLKRVLIADKHFNPEYLKKVVGSDLYILLSNYAEISPNNVDFNINIDKNGDYIFNLTAKTSRLKIFGSLPE